MTGWLGIDTGSSVAMRPVPCHRPKFAGVSSTFPSALPISRAELAFNTVESAMLPGGGIILEEAF